MGTKERPLTVNFTKCWYFARELGKLPVSPILTSDEVSSIIELVRKHGITIVDFVLLAEKPERFQMSTEIGEFHRKLCYVNSRYPELFDALTENEREIRHHQLVTAVRKYRR
jgi:hypothetical protein